MEAKKEKIIQQITKKLFGLLGVEGDFEFSQKDDAIDMVLETKDSGMVIGYHGEMLEALQLILSLCISKKLDTFVRVSIEVGDYKKNRTDWLESLAMQTKEQVLLENKEVALPNLRPWERRIVHMLFQDDKKIMSESIGEGKSRTLVIKPR